METFVSRLFSQATPRASRASLHVTSKQRRDLRFDTTTFSCAILCQTRRTFAASPLRPLIKKPESPNPTASELGEHSSYAQPAHKVSQSVSQEEEDHYDRLVEHSKEQQVRSPWMRAGSDTPPVARQRSASAMTKGKKCIDW